MYSNRNCSNVIIITLLKLVTTESDHICLITGIHAREWISPATATFFLRSLVENQANGTRSLLNDFDVYILPVANPDG